MSLYDMPLEETDFDRQMKSLAVDAQQQIDERVERKAVPSFLQMLRPLVIGLEALTRATVENKEVLSRLEVTASMQTALPPLMAGVQETLDKRSAINQQLFDALHEELKGYRDGFLLEVIQKPLVRDLVCLYDDLSTIGRQITNFAGGASAPDAAQSPVALDFLRNLGKNLDHAVDFLLEVMSRMDVKLLEPAPGKLDKKNQRAVSVEHAELPEEDGEIIRRVKPGFTWRDRILRPEEVVVKKWKEGYLVDMSADSQK